MGIDHAGHRAGADSRAYRDAARATDALLAAYLPRWLEAGYPVLITSDHGMDADGSHTDPTPAARRVPLWLAGAPGDTKLPTRQTGIAPLAARLLGLTWP